MRSITTISSFRAVSAVASLLCTAVMVSPASAQADRIANEGINAVDEIRDARKAASKKDEKKYVKDVLGAENLNSDYFQQLYNAVAENMDTPAPVLLIKDTSWAQAYVAGGSSIGVTVGLINGMFNEAQYACLLAHEFGHISLDHHERAKEEASRGNASKDLTKNAIGSLGRRLGAPSNVTRELQRFADNALARSYKKEFENEADAYGLNLVMKMGYDPYECANAFYLLDFFFRAQGSEIFGEPKNYDTLRSRARALRAQAESLTPLDNGGLYRRAEFELGRAQLLETSIVSSSSLSADADNLQNGKIDVSTPMKTPDMPPCEQETFEKLEQHDADTRHLRNIMVAGYVLAGFDSGMVQDIPLDQMVESFSSVDTIANCQAQRIIDNQVLNCESMRKGPNNKFWRKVSSEIAKQCN